MLANVGSSNGIMRVTDGFPSVPRQNINWYYNPDQDFINDLDSELRRHRLL
jgi:hypothetical protein